MNTFVSPAQDNISQLHAFCIANNMASLWSASMQLNMELSWAAPARFWAGERETGLGAVLIIIITSFQLSGALPYRKKMSYRVSPMVQLAQ